MSTAIKVHCSHTELVDVVKLVEHPNNPNQHDDRQINLLARIIKAQGWRNPITVSNRSGYIVSGHGRLAAAKVLNESKVPVDYQDFDNEADELAHLLADNRIAELAELDFKGVENILNELRAQDFDLDLTGFESIEIDNFLLKDDLIIDTNIENAEYGGAIDDIKMIQLFYNPENETKFRTCVEKISKKYRKIQKNLEKLKKI